MFSLQVGNAIEFHITHGTRLFCLRFSVLEILWFLASLPIDLQFASFHVCECGRNPISEEGLPALGSYESPDR